MQCSRMTWEESVIWLRSQPDKQELVRACFYDDPLTEAAQRFHASEEWQALVCKLPQSKGFALDIGAGRGIASYALAVDGWVVTALEPDPSFLVGAGAIESLVESFQLPITVVREWGEKLPFADASFDVVHARQVLHHSQNLGDFCREVARVLKPGGIFVATREHVIDLPDELVIFREHHDLHKLYGGECAFALEHYLDSISNAGLLLKEVLCPSQSVINYFPASEEDIRNRALQCWNWDYEMGYTIMCKQADSLLASPGRLYTFVAYKSAYNSDEEKLLSETASNVVLLDARLHARDIVLRKLIANYEVAVKDIEKRLESRMNARFAVLENYFVVRGERLMRKFLSKFMKKI